MVEMIATPPPTIAPSSTIRDLQRLLIATSLGSFAIAFSFPLLRLAVEPENWFSADVLCVVGMLALPYLVAFAGVLTSLRKPALYQIYPPLIVSGVGISGVVLEAILPPDAQKGFLLVGIWLAQLLLSPVSMLLALDRNYWGDQDDAAAIASSTPRQPEHVGATQTSARTEAEIPTISAKLDRTVQLSSDVEAAVGGVDAVPGETVTKVAKETAQSPDYYENPVFLLRVEVLSLALLLSAFGLGFLVFRSRPNPDSLAVVALFFAIPYLISLAGVLISSKRPARYMVLPTLLLSLIGVAGTVYAVDIQRTDAQGGMMFLLIWYVQIVLSPISLVMAALRRK